MRGLWRAEHVLQVGPAHHPLILEPVPAQAATALRHLGDPHTVEELDQLVPDLGRDWLEWLLARLQDADLVRRWHPHRPPSIAVHGGGTLAAGLQRALHRAGLAPLPPEQPNRLDEADLVVIACHTCEPERWLTSQLTAAGRASLIVRAEPDRGVVGPWVDPGRTPCLRCLDLLRSELDPRWPRLLAQLCGTRWTPDPAMVDWLVGEAVADIARWHSGRPSDLAGRTLELWLPGYQRYSSSWAQHPACSCQASSLGRVGTLAG